MLTGTWAIRPYIVPATVGFSLEEQVTLLGSPDWQPTNLPGRSAGNAGPFRLPGGPDRWRWHEAATQLATADKRSNLLANFWQNYVKDVLDPVY
jgi:hypothetical protein